MATVARCDDGFETHTGWQTSIIIIIVILILLSVVVLRVVPVPSD